MAPLLAPGGAPGPPSQESKIAAPKRASKRGTRCPLARFPTPADNHEA